MTYSHSGIHATSQRHPVDPDPVPSSKVIAAFVLAGVGLCLAPFVGGAIPASFALVLARQAERDIRDSDGWLLGAAKLRRIRALAWTALGLAATVLVIGLLIWVISLASGAGQPQFDGNTV
ncbi:hypothetical protein [Natronoglycomyces albus]|uniref:DUF4190 domain-containing protein n=1 Tax=Natronoglycomyces albus TaxID=2811108 RepID=A0A895XHX8_9ACTN|nr:hypothetical protein [Natronoglycomyces albus]QSB04547.1 hypothetical protein JQS30_12290 [Natronoglycomyces albus]